MITLPTLADFQGAAERRGVTLRWAFLQINTSNVSFDRWVKGKGYPSYSTLSKLIDLLNSIPTIEAAQ